MSQFSSLLKASVRIFVRSKQALFFSLFMPLVIMLILGAIGFDRTPQYNVGIVSDHPQAGTQQFIDSLKKLDVLKVTEGSLDDEKKALTEGDRVLVLSVPSNFIEAGRTSPQEMLAYVNESQQAQAQAIISILNQFLDKTSLQLAHAQSAFTIRQEATDARHLKYIDYLLPGLIAMSVMQMSVFSVAFLFVQYKEKGILRRLAATPMKPFHFVSANAVTRLAMSVVQTAIFMATGIFLLKAHVIGSYPLILLSVILGALMFLGLGFTISGVAKTVESVPAFANLIVFPMLFLGGTFFPTSSMPNWLQSVAKFLPLTFFGNSLREIMTKGSGIGVIKWDLVGMLAWGVVFISLATMTFSFQERDSA